MGVEGIHGIARKNRVSVNKIMIMIMIMIVHGILK